MVSYPFLRQVVDAYTSPEELPFMGEYCFVFPNRRSSTFFKRYLINKFDQLGQPSFMPSFTTITDFIGRYSHGAQASRNELLFALYDSYREVLEAKGRKEQVADFDRFRFWAEMVINDFNDVDMFMVDPMELFKNVKDLKEISADYLTDEQKSVLAKYWGDDFPQATGEEVERFWLHTIPSGEDGESLSGKFLKLWEILAELYITFKKNLRRQGLTYNGMAYREACDRLRATEPDKLPFRRYIFVGFNVLSTSEIIIFEHLKKIGCADFYWDFASPAFFKESVSGDTSSLKPSMIDFNNRATRFVGRNVLKFPSIHPLPLLAETNPSINVLAIPGNTAQAGETGHILDRWAQDRAIIPNRADAINTCVVVNDESLFIPLLHSIPDSIGAINITMGLPMRHTEVATLVSAIISMQLRRRRLRGAETFFYEDVLTVLNHPLIIAIAGNDSSSLQKRIIDNRVYNVDIDDTGRDFPELAFIFTSAGSPDNKEEVYDYMERLLNSLHDKIAMLKETGHPVDGSDRQLAILDFYSHELDELRQLSGKYRIAMNNSSWFHLIESFINSSSLNFVGMPLKGLQIMNMLETRTLDFENLIILSMNERIFPKKHVSRTFIPAALRAGYGLSTIEHQESIFSYYFYRLLTRAKNVYLLYDSRTNGISSGEMSRYLYQLKYIRPYRDIKFLATEYKPSSAEKREITIEKNQEELARFMEGGDLFLSASALKTYAHCPLQFYLTYVKRWSNDTEATDYMGAITYGLIIHSVMQTLYETVRGNADMVKITPQTLDFMMDMKHPTTRINMIEQLVQTRINCEYHRLPEEKWLSPLAGESKLLASIMVKSIRHMLEKEKAYTPFCFCKAEYSKAFVWEIAPRLKVNFKMAVDRIDYLESDGSLRFIDYKTGADEVDVGKIEQLLNPQKKYQAVFQLLTYAEAYCAYKGKDIRVQPFIYSIRSIVSDGLRPVTFTAPTGKREILGSNLQVRDGFRNYLGNLVGSIFDTSQPFTQSKDDTNCKYCAFASLCDRLPKDDN